MLAPTNQRFYQQPTRGFHWRSHRRSQESVAHGRRLPHAAGSFVSPVALTNQIYLTKTHNRFCTKLMCPYPISKFHPIMHFLNQDSCTCPLLQYHHQISTMEIRATLFSHCALRADGGNEIDGVRNAFLMAPRQSAPETLPGQRLRQKFSSPKEMVWQACGSVCAG